MRIQVLTLPSEKVGEVEKYPFALIIDQAADIYRPDKRRDVMEWWGDKCGAVATLITDQTVEVI